MTDRMPVRADAGGLAELLVPHLDSAYNLARWLVRNAEDAEDVVQEACLRAFQYSDGFRGGDARAWLLTIVRNTSYNWLRKTRAHEPVTQFDEEIHTGGVETSNPEQLLLQTANAGLVEKALSELPVRFREILVLRELELPLVRREVACLDVDAVARARPVPACRRRSPPNRCLRGIGPAARREAYPW